MNMVPLKASARAKESRANVLRSQGVVPCVVYGNADNALLQVEEKALRKAYIKAGESSLVELETDAGKLPVLFHALDLDPVNDRLMHVDFYAVNMKKEVEADVHIRFEGEAPAVKEMGAVLVTALHEVTVRCLPAHLPHDLAVQLSALTEFGATLTVADINIPEGVTILTDKESVLAIAQEPRAEEVVVPATPAEGEAPAAGTEAAAEGAAAPSAEKTA